MIYSRIKNRRDREEFLLTENPVLGDGEIVLVFDDIPVTHSGRTSWWGNQNNITGTTAQNMENFHEYARAIPLTTLKGIKVGNGVLSFSALPYFEGNKDDVGVFYNSANNSLYAAWGATANTLGDYAVNLTHNGLVIGGHSAAIGGIGHVIPTGVTSSVILGGSGITAATSNTVYVPKLNVSGVELVTTGATTGQTLIHDGTSFRPSDDFKKLLDNRANLVHLDGTRTYYNTASQAVTAATSGDTLLIPSNIIDLSKTGNTAQLWLPPSVSLHTLGFQLGREDGRADVITTSPVVVGGVAVSASTGTIMGGNSLISTNTNSGTWGYGTYGFSAGQSTWQYINYDIYDLYFKNRGSSNAALALYAWNSRTRFFNCTIDHAASNGVGVVVGNNSVADFYNCNFIGGSNSLLIHAAQVVATGSTINLYNCTLTLNELSSIKVGSGATINFVDCTIDARARTDSANLIRASDNASYLGTIKLVNTSLIANTSAANAIKCDTIVLEGSTVVIGSMDAITIIDNRPKGLSISADTASIISLTHAQLLTRISGNTLAPATYYKITDYATKHQVFGVTGATAIHTGTTEPLIVRANSSSGLDAYAFSLAFPSDIIMYDPLNVLCEDGVTARKGFITYREDTIRRNVVKGYDFRNVVFETYPLDAPAWSGTVSDYPKWGIVSNLEGGAKSFYMSTYSGNNSYVLSDNTKWMKLFDPSYNFGYNGGLYGFKTVWNHSSNTSIYKFSVNLAAPRRYYTFNCGGRDASSSPAPKADLYANFEGYNNYIDATFLGVKSNVVIANLTSGGNPLADNHFARNIFNNRFINCQNFMFRGFILTDNVFDAAGGVMLFGEAQGNTTYKVLSTILGSPFRNNVITYYMNSCVLGFYSSNNVFGKFIQNCIFGYTNWLNNFGNMMDSCTFGANAKNNYFNSQSPLVEDAPNSTSYITTGVNFQRNVFQQNANNSVFGDYCSGNTYNQPFTNSGTLAQPILLKGNTFNSQVSGLTISGGGVLNSMVVNVPIISKTIPALTGETISYKSPDGSLWINGIDNSGHLSPEKIA